MKLSMKSLIATGLIALSCTCSAFAAPTVESLATEITQPGGFYTLYHGMPLADFENNWGNISGWTRTHTQNQNSKDYWNDTFERTYKLNGETVCERVDVTTNHKTGVVHSFSWWFYADDIYTAEAVFYGMYDKLAAMYPGFTEKMPRAPIHISNKRPYYVIGNGDQALTFFMSREINKGKHANQHFISYCYRKYK